MAVSYDKNNQTSGLNSAERLNAELTKIQTALLDAVSRSGNAPNAMSADLDLGDNDILNVGRLDCSELLVDGAPLPSVENIIEAFEDGQAALDDSIAQAQQDLNDAVVQANSDLSAAVSQANSDLAAAVADATSDLNSAVSSAESTIQGYVSTAQSAAADAQLAQAAASSSASDAEDARVAAVAAQAAAEDARDEAADLIASVELPEISPADAGKVLSVSPAGQYEVALVLEEEIAKAVAQLTRWAPFAEFGSAGTSTMTDMVAADAISTTRVVAYSATDGELRTLEFDGSTWSEVASGAAPIAIGATARIKGASPQRAMLVTSTLTNNKIQMFQESSGTWSAVGTDAIVSMDTGFVDVTALSSTSAVTVSAEGYLRIHLFNGTGWSTVGALAITDEGSRPLVISFPDNRVIVYLRNSGQFACYEWDGYSFHHVSTSTNFGWTSASPGGAVVSMCPLGRMDFVASRAFGAARIIRFDGHDWYTADATSGGYIVGAGDLFPMNDHVIGSLSSNQVQAFSTQLTLGRPNTPISGDWT